MPKKAVAVFFLLAFLGAGLFVYFTFPRNKDEFPKSNNQMPLVPITPSPNVPNGAPVPESVPTPNSPKVPPGPSLHVMVWATGPEAASLSSAADAFSAATGRRVALTIEPDPVSYRRDLHQAFVSGDPPDLCLINSRDFDGIDPTEELADVTPIDSTPPRARDAFTVDGRLKAVPDEFSVVVLFYNPALFDQASIGYPGRHWNWDMLAADARAFTSLKLKDATGQPVYAIELPSNFDIWNVLCAESGAPALDLNAWRLSDASAKEAQMHALELLHDLFQEYAITPPPSNPPAALGHLFIKGRAALLIASSDLATGFPSSLQYGVSVLPRDLAPASVASINGWAVPAKASDQLAAQSLAAYLAQRPVHTGWYAVAGPTGAGDDDASPSAVCHEALAQSLVPRLDASTVHMAEFLDQQLNQLAHNPAQTPQLLFAKIQAQVQAPSAPPEVRGEVPVSPGDGDAPVPRATVSTQLRGL